MSNFNSFEQHSLYRPRAIERGLLKDSSSQDNVKKAIIASTLAISAIRMSQADKHHAELYGMSDAVQLSRLNGSHKLTNAVHMIEQRMTGIVDSRIADAKSLEA